MEPAQPPGSQLTGALTPEGQRIASHLLKTLSHGYRGDVSPLSGLRYDALDYNQPVFHRYWIRAMERDPHLWYGFQMLRGPIISKAKYEVECEEEDIAWFVQKQIDKFWANGVSQTLASIEYGYCGVEVFYKYNPDKRYMEYDHVRYFKHHDVRPVLHKSRLVGMRLGNVKNKKGEEKKARYIPLPKCLWTVHDRRRDRWFGRSRYEGAFIPWYETWQPKGYRNIRHLAMYKYSFDGGVIKYPEGSVQDPETGEELPNAVIAQRMLDMRESGAGLAMPAQNFEFGGWDYIPPTSPGIPETLFIYGDSLRDEKWEGIGVPPEVAKNEGTGSFAGRRVPQQAFYSFLQDIANEQVFDFDEQVLRFLVQLNFGAKASRSYEIKPISILKTLQEEEMGVVTGKLPGEEDPQMEAPLSNGRIEDRDSNAFNLAEKSQKDSKSEPDKKKEK
jgi:hypothetical protein